MIENTENIICNIDFDGIKLRKFQGFVSSVLFCLNLIILTWLKSPFLFISSFLFLTITIINYYQVTKKFCVAFGLRGIDDSTGDFKIVQNQKYNAFLKHSFEIVLKSFLISILIHITIYCIFNYLS